MDARVMRRPAAAASRDRCRRTGGRRMKPEVARHRMPGRQADVIASADGRCGHARVRRAAPPLLWQQTARSAIAYPAR